MTRIKAAMKLCEGKAIRNNRWLDQTLNVKVFRNKLYFYRENERYKKVTDYYINGVQLLEDGYEVFNGN